MQAKIDSKFYNTSDFYKIDFKNIGIKNENGMVTLVDRTATGIRESFVNPKAVT